MAYTPTNWTNFPSTATPVSASNLNKIENELVALDTGKADESAVTTALEDKVDKVEGYGLSENDFDDTYKDKLDGISEQANKVEITPVVTEGTTLATISIDGVDTDIKGSDIDVDDEMSPTSPNPVQNKVIYAELQNLLPEETAEGNPISITDASGLSAKSCEVSFSPIQSGSGEPSPENVRPISGWDSLVLNCGGKNLFDISTMNHSPIVVSDGVATATASQFYTYYENGGNKLWVNTLKGAFTFSFYAKREGTSGTSGNGLQVKFVYTDGTVSTQNLANSTTEYTKFSYTVSTQKTVDYITLGYSSQGNNVWDLKEMQIETGNTATDYEPYKGLTTHTATFPSTVYGGKLDFVNATLTKTMAIVDLGTLAWGKIDAVSGKHRFSAYVELMKLSTLQIMCSNYPKSSSTYGGNLGIQTSNNNLYIFDGDYEDASGAEFKQAMSGVQFCYELATPQEIVLTAEQIALLKGNNVLFTDGDNIKLVYSADIKQWTLNQLQS